MNRPLLRLVEDDAGEYRPEPLVELERSIPIEPFPRITETVLQNECAKAARFGFVIGWLACSVVTICAVGFVLFELGGWQ